MRQQDQNNLAQFWRYLSALLSARDALLSILTQCNALCCSWATRKSMAQHLGLRLVVVAPVPNRGCSRCRPKEGVIGQPRGPELLH
jgi:hypothetical protein